MQGKQVGNVTPTSLNRTYLELKLAAGAALVVAAAALNRTYLELKLVMSNFTFFMLLTLNRTYLELKLKDTLKVVATL